MTFSVYFLIETNKLRFSSEKHCPCTYFFGAGRKEPQSGGGCGAGSGSFPVGAGAGYIQVSLEQSFP